MKAKIKTFKETAKMNGGVLDFDTAEEKMLSDFSDFMSKGHKILSINFGKKDGVYMDESPHYWYIQILYLENTA